MWRTNYNSVAEMLVAIFVMEGEWYPNQPECKCSTRTLEQEEKTEITQKSVSLYEF